MESDGRMGHEQTGKPPRLSRAGTKDAGEQLCLAWMGNWALGLYEAKWREVGRSCMYTVRVQ
jgi:hypothetical protein